MNSYDRQPYSWFVRECRDSICENVETSGNPEHRQTQGRNPRKIDAYINQWYLKGLVDELFDIAWDDFKFQVLNGWGGKYSKSWSQRMRIPRYSRWGAAKCSFRGHSKYVRNVDHLPKEADEGQIWRAIQNLKRDRYKHAATWRHRGRGSKYKQFCKTQGAREHRAWVRQQLGREDYDRFSDREYVEFADPWRWD